MRTKTKQAVAAFSISLVFILLLYGIAIVDLSTDRYMPGLFGPMFQLSAMGPEGVEVSLLGEEYLLSIQVPTWVQRAVARVPGLIPHSVRAGIAMVRELDYRYQQYEEQQRLERLLW